MSDFDSPDSSIYKFYTLTSPLASKELCLSVDGLSRELSRFALSSLRGRDVDVWLGFWLPYFENWSLRSSLMLFLEVSRASKLRALMGFLFYFYKFLFYFSKLVVGSLSESDLLRGSF
jgi:hypothetical protein